MTDVTEALLLTLAIADIVNVVTTLVCYIEHALLSTDMVLMMQYAAQGQQGLEFFSEQHGVGDSAREDIQCHILGRALEPSEIKVKERIPPPADPDGIHSNKEGLSKASLIIYAIVATTSVACNFFKRLCQSTCLIVA